MDKNSWRPPRHFPYQKSQEHNRRLHRQIHSWDWRSLSKPKPQTTIHRNDQGLVKDRRLIGCRVCGHAMHSPLLPGQYGSCCLHHFQQFRPVSCGEGRFNVRRMNGKRDK